VDKLVDNTAKAQTVDLRGKRKRRPQVSVPIADFADQKRCITT
jgi:hypothetical protein